MSAKLIAPKAQVKKNTPDRIVFHERLGRVGRLIEQIKPEMLFVDSIRLPDESSSLFSLDECESLIGSSRMVFQDFLTEELGGTSALRKRFSDDQILKKALAANGIFSPKVFRAIRRHITGFNQHAVRESVYLLAAISLDEKLFEHKIRKDAFSAIVKSAPFCAHSSRMLVRMGYSEEKILDILRDELVPIRHLFYGLGAGIAAVGLSLCASASSFSSAIIGFAAFFSTTLIPGLTKQVMEWVKWGARARDWVEHFASDIDRFLNERRREVFDPNKENGEVLKVRDLGIPLKV